MNPIQVAVRGNLGTCLEVGEYIAQVHDERDVTCCYVDLNDEVLYINAIVLIFFGSRAIDVQIGFGAGVTRQHQQVAIVIESVVVV